MTISSEVRKAGPYSGNDVTTSFPFSFKVFSADDMVVVRTNATDIETTLTGGTDYSVTLNADQDTSPGGSITLPAALASGFLLTITSSVPNLQTLDLTNQGGFYPRVINAALDRVTILVQQVSEQVGRAVKVGISSALTPDQLIDQLNANVVAAQASATAADVSAGNADTSEANAAASAAAAAASAGAIALPLPIESGGTGAITAAAARTALGAGAASGLATLDAGGKVPTGQLPALASDGLFYKADPTAVAFTKTGAGTATIKAGTKIAVVGTVVTFASDTAITMPSLTAGTDYAVWLKDDATIQATTNFTSAPGAGNWRKIGGFHYAPGGNAAAVAGGDTTPAINAYSLWDVKFRPACPDPRGMTLVADSFWSDIYMLGVDHLTNGTSKYNVTIADGSSPPKIPTKFGGNGSTAYSTLNWWEANEVLQSWGKRSPSYDEYAALAYGTTEATSSGGTDVPTTGVSGTGATNAWNKFTSKWGAIQSTGCLYVWGAEFGGGAAGAAWTANTGGRGSSYQMEIAVFLGGAWSDTTGSGSRCSMWKNSPTYSNNGVGARGVCDHLILD
jgi:hypothetical protein